MDTAEKTQHVLHARPEQLLSVVRAMIGVTSGREDDEHPLPPGPWDPVIRIALENLSAFGPHPEPWATLVPAASLRGIGSIFGERSEFWKLILTSITAKHPEIFDALGGGHSFADEVSLNPQPLPPRLAFLGALARAVVSRAELLQEIADAMQREGEQQGIIIVSGYINKFVDDYCGTSFKLKYPFPGPRPHWFNQELSGVDLLITAAQFEQSAKETFNNDLRQTLSHASLKLAEAGLQKIQ